MGHTKSLIMIFAFNFFLQSSTTVLSLDTMNLNGIKRLLQDRWKWPAYSNIKGFLCDMTLCLKIGTNSVWLTMISHIRFNQFLLRKKNARQP